MATKNVHISEELLAKLRSTAADEGKSVDEIAEDVLRRHLARQTLDRLGTEGKLRRGVMSEDEVESIVERAIREARHQ